MKRLFLISVLLMTLIAGCGKPYLKNETNSKTKATGESTKNTDADTVNNKDTDDDGVDLDYVTLYKTLNDLNEVSAIKIDKRKPAKPVKEKKEEKVTKTVTKNADEVIKEVTVTEKKSEPVPVDDTLLEILLYIAAIVLVLVALLLLKNWIAVAIFIAVVIALLIIRKLKGRGK